MLTLLLIGKPKNLDFINFYRESHQQLRKKGSDMFSSLRHANESRKGRRLRLFLLLSFKPITFLYLYRLALNKLRNQASVTQNGG